MNNQLDLYTNENSPAFLYSAKIFFELISGFKLTIRPLSEANSAIKGVVYAKKAVNMLPLLEQISLSNSETDFVPKNNIDYQGYTFPFKSSNNSIMPYDPIALTLLLLTSPQEQLQIGKYDIHTRYIDQNSWIKTYSMDKFPLLNIASEHFLKIYQKYDYSIKIATKEYSYTPTFDIDIAFAHSAKTFYQHILSYLLLLKKFDINNLTQKTLINFFNKSDPFNVFDFILKELEKNNLTAIFFVMTANRGEFDKNNFYNSKKYIELISKISKNHIIGIHPSYNSFNNNKKILIEEISRLEKIIKKPITHSRQHYLRQQIPNSWKILIENGIEHDYTAGYSNDYGYKFGTYSTFPAYDFIEQQELSLKIHPFGFMDTAFYKYLKYDNNKIFETIKNEANIAKQNNYQISSVWHNYAMPANSDKLKLFAQLLEILSKK